MPIAYNPTRAYQPARVVDVHAELYNSVQQRRREARSQQYAKNRSSRLPTIQEDMEVDFDLPQRIPYARYPPMYPRDEL